MANGKANKAQIAKLRNRLVAQELLTESALNTLIERYEERKAKTKPIFFWKINEYDRTIDALESLLDDMGIKKEQPTPDN